MNAAAHVGMGRSARRARAYERAVAHGYEGTPEDYAADMRAFDQAVGEGFGGDLGAYLARAGRGRVVSEDSACRR